MFSRTNTTANCTTNRRFYDQEPTVSLAINTVLAFSQNFQGIAAKGMSLVAIKDFRANDRMDQSKSLGKDIILPLYKSKQKKRFYDSNPDMHNALNYLRLLTQEERIITATKLLDIARYMEHYLNICESSTSEPEIQKLQNIRDLYIMRGETDVREYTESLCIEMLKHMSLLETKDSSNTARKLQVEISKNGKIVGFDHL